MQIKVKQLESDENGVLFVATWPKDRMKIFLDAFKTGQETARKAWGE